MNKFAVFCVLILVIFGCNNVRDKNDSDTIFDQLNNKLTQWNFKTDLTLEQDSDRIKMYVKFKGVNYENEEPHTDFYLDLKSNKVILQTLICLHKEYFLSFGQTQFEVHFEKGEEMISKTFFTRKGLDDYIKEVEENDYYKYIDVSLQEISYEEKNTLNSALKSLIKYADKDNVFQGEVVDYWDVLKAHSSSCTHENPSCKETGLLLLMMYETKYSLSKHFDKNMFNALEQILHNKCISKEYFELKESDYYSQISSSFFKVK